MGLRDYQREAVDSVFNYFAERDGSPVICCPTGGGKTHISSTLIKEVIECCPSESVLLLAHRKELLAQSFEKLIRTWPGAPAGVFSAGLGKKQLRQVTVAGIQSIHRARHLPPYATVIIDECHLLPRKGNGMYLSLLDRLRDRVPELRLVGMTATPWRMESGHLCRGPDAMFTDICYDISIRRLIEEGHLVPFVSKQAHTQPDLAGVHTRGGDFVPGEAERAMDRDEIVRGAVDEICENGADRRSWLVFCSGVDHAENVRQEIQSRGVVARCVFGHTPPAERTRAINEFKTGRIRALISVDVLLIGFDAPCADLIAVLRPTKSPGLHIQMIGRGSRLSPETGKRDCLVLDFAGNLVRLGPIDAVVPPREKHRGDEALAEEGEEAVSGIGGKCCPNCLSVSPVGIFSCPDCGYEWEKPAPKHEATAFVAEVISSAPPASESSVRTLPVFKVSYRVHKKNEKPDSLRVTYSVGLDSVAEWILPEHGGYFARKAEKWWKERSRFNGDMPATAAEMKKAADRELKAPTAIRVRTNRHGFNEVVGYYFPEVASTGTETPEAKRECEQSVVPYLQGAS